LRQAPIWRPARRLHIPCLLNWALVSPRHNGVEVTRLWPLQFDGSENDPFAAGERPERGIDSTSAQCFFGCNRVSFARAVGRVAKQRDEDRLNEFAPDGCLPGLVEIRMADLFGPIFRNPELPVRWFENYLGELAPKSLPVEQPSSAAKIEAFLRCHTPMFAAFARIRQWPTVGVLVRVESLGSVLQAGAFGASLVARFQLCEPLSLVFAATQKGPTPDTPRPLRVSLLSVRVGNPNHFVHMAIEPRNDSW
jgi:hypothetical protein